MIPSRDSGHYTADSLAAANEWHAANEQLAALHERERKHGADAVSTAEHIEARQRIDAALTALTIPHHLLRYAERDWQGSNTLGRQEQWRQAQDAWATAHGIDRTQYERLQEIKLRQRRPRTRGATP
jgi:hypothetical protein